MSNERCYVPQEEDVGRCLKLEVRVLHSSNGAPLFHTPRVADTEPVLSSPPLPPKRMMATVKVRPTQPRQRAGQGAVLTPVSMCVWCSKPWPLGE